MSAPIPADLLTAIKERYGNERLREHASELARYVLVADLIDELFELRAHHPHYTDTPFIRAMCVCGEPLAAGYSTKLDDEGFVVVTVSDCGHGGA